MSSPRTARIDIRSHRLAEAAEIQDTEAGRFFVLPEPPPVRSILAVREGDELEAFEVTRVVEVESQGQARGAFARIIDMSELDKSIAEVGTEHLSALAENDLDTQGGSDQPQMAVPAPVVHPEASEQIDVGNLPDMGELSANDSSEANPTDEGARKGKRRKGRKRRE